MIHIVNGLLISDGAVLMAHRSPNRAHYANSWSFPGGHVEAGETLEEAVVREMSEEIGITTMNPALMEFPITTSGPKGLIRFHFFKITAWTGSPKNHGTEHTQIRWIPLTEAPQMPNLALPDYAGLFQLLSPTKSSPPKPTIL